MRRSATVRREAAVLLALVVAGCGGSARVFVNPDADFSYYRKVAVLPFSNLTQQRFAGDLVTRAFVTELVIAGRFQVVEPAEFRLILDRLGVESSAGSVDPEKLKAAAVQVEATGVIRGAVTEYQMTRLGQNEFPVVGFDVELIDVATGKVAWRAAVSRKGRGRLPLLGGGAKTLGRVTQDACVQVVGALRGRAL